MVRSPLCLHIFPYGGQRLGVGGGRGEYHTVAFKLDYMYTEKSLDPNVVTVALQLFSFMVINGNRHLSRNLLL